jgi:DNA polymerase elongation subunit (family B)
MRIIGGWSRGENDICLVCRTGDSKFEKYITHFQPYFLIDKKLRDVKAVSDLKDRGKIVAIELDEIYAKLVIRSVKEVAEARDYLEERNIKTFESDIPFVRRYLIDEQMPIGTEPLRFLYIDIETDDTIPKIEVGAYPILSIACIDAEEKKKFFINHDVNDKGKEREMIWNFIQIAKEYDVLVAWNGDAFDFPYLEMRARKLGISFTWRYWQKLDLMWKFKSLKPLQSYALDAVSKSELGEEKIKFDGKIIDLYLNNKDLLCRYNIQDCLLMKKLDEKYNITKFLDVMSSKTNCFLEEIQYPTIIVDNCVLRKVKELKMNLHFPYRGRMEKKKFEGAYVMEPPAGQHKNLLVLDFTSLYNRIMQSWNISPETLNKGSDRIHVPESEIYFGKETKGILPIILEELEKERNFYKKRRNQADKGSPEYERNDMLQNSVKTILLSFYGVMGNPTSRYYHNDIAGSVTRIGRWLIKASKTLLEDKGYKILYIDTDSLLVKLDTDNLDEQINIGNNLSSDLNSFYIKLLESFNIDMENRKIEMKFEKVASRIIFVGDEKRGTKKRYAGIQTWEEGKKVDNKFFAKGLELVRTDWSNFAKRLQKEVIMQVFSDKIPEEIGGFILREREKVEKKELSKEDLVISQMLTKKLEEYKTDIPHVKVAKEMLNRGKEVWTGQKIRMIFINKDKKVEPIIPDDFKGDYDDEYYWNNKIYPPCERILKAVHPEFRWEWLYIKKTASKATRKKADKKLKDTMSQDLNLYF